jgi:Ig-like domain-containing protein/Big-like domain-containing protein
LLKTNLFKISAVVAATVCGVVAGAQAGTYKTITIDGDFSDWTGVPIAYTNENGVNNPSGVDFQNVYLANDDNYLYIRYTLQQPADPITAGNTYIWLDNDGNAATGFHPFGNANFGSSLMIIADQSYQEAGGGFNEGSLTNASVVYGASTIPGTNFEFRISRSVVGVAGAYAGVRLLDNATIGVQLASETGTGDSLPAFNNYGLLTYTFESVSSVTTNVPLITLGNTPWKVNASGTDLGTGWLDQSYDDTQSPWTAGNGLFGYTPTPGAYPAINTALSGTGQNTYYFRTHFTWTNQPENIAFVVTNYLSDGAVYYLNGVEVGRVRMPNGAVTFNTSALSTNSPVGHPDVFGIPGGLLVIGDNILEVETHQQASSSDDMVFGLSLTAAAQFPILVLDTNQPADRTVIGGNPTTFSANILGSGPLSFQWLKDGSPVPGATNAQYTIAQAINSDAGAYSLRIVNSISTNLTRAAVLTISNAPVSFVDASQPANQVVVEGRPATLSAVVAGSPPFQYQWYYGGSPVPGATNLSYVISSAMPTNSGSYYITVSNPVGPTNSRTAALTVLLDTLPPTVTSVTAAAGQVVVTFSEPVDAVSAGNAAHYGINNGVGVVSATPNGNTVTLVTSVPLNLGTVYNLTINGVADLFGNALGTTAAFARTITIDGDFSDWDGVTPIYSGPEGLDGAADFKDIYMYNDADFYYFRVTLWHDIPPASGQFPAYVNMFFNTDNDPGTGYSAIGSDLLIQSGFSYQEKNGGFNEGAINGLNWLSLPSAPGTNFEFRFSRAATYASDGTAVFPTNVLTFLFQGMTPGFAPVNTAASDGSTLSYTNTAPLTVASLPLGRLAIAPVPGNNAAVVWDSPGILQFTSSLEGNSWTNVPSATSPYVVPPAGGKQFFRLKK